MENERREKNQRKGFTDVPSLKLTFSPLKIGIDWKGSSPNHPCSGALTASFREGIKMTRFSATPLIRGISTSMVVSGSPRRW